MLLEQLVRSTEVAGIWTIQTGIFPENEASVRPHERIGIKAVARREHLGRLNGGDGTGQVPTALRAAPPVARPAAPKSRYLSGAKRIVRMYEIIEGEALVPTHNVQPSQSSRGMDLEGS